MAVNEEGVLIYFVNADGINETPVSLAAPLPVALSSSAGARQGTLTDRSGTVTAGGTAVTAAPANAARRYLLIVNPTTAAEQGVATAETLWVNFTTPAALASPAVPLEPGQSFVFDGEFVTTEAVSVNTTTTAHRFVIKEG